MLLTIDDVSKSYGDVPVLNQVSLDLAPGQKLGLVGANGVGKSTLLKIIVGEELADSGAVRLHQDATIGYLPQVFQGADALTVDQLLARALGDLTEMEVRLHRLEAKMGNGDGELDAILAEYGRLAEAFDRRGGYALAHRRAAVMSGLQVDHIAPHRRVGTLSGGEKSRIGLTALLLRNPDLLLLDEPTNHLDFAALAWLEKYLRDFKGGLIAVSHDRHFLNETIDALVEIDEHSKEAKHYSGSYDFYAAVKAQERVKWEESYWAQQEEIWELRKAIKGKARQIAHNRPPRDGDKFLAYFKAERMADAISRNVRAAEERLRRIEADPIPKPPRRLEINPDFDPATLTSHVPLVATGLAKRYGDNVVLEQADVTIDKGSRIVIVGPNGAGKSTLLRILAGHERPDAGAVHIAAGVVVGYLDQEQSDLDPASTLFDTFRAGRPGDYETYKAELLGYGLFVYPELAKVVHTLSIGQKRKLQLARLLTQHANLLLLDEPTNHISLDVLEEFETALDAFAGPIVAVSHDRRFIQRFAHEIWHVDQGRVHRYLGGWEDFQAEAAVVAGSALA